MTSEAFGSEAYRKEREEQMGQRVEEIKGEYEALAAEIKAHSHGPIEEARLLAAHCLESLLAHEEEYVSLRAMRAAEAVLFDAFPWLQDARAIVDRMTTR